MGPTNLLRRHRPTSLPPQLQSFGGEVKRLSESQPQLVVRRDLFRCLVTESSVPSPQHSCNANSSAEPSDQECIYGNQNSADGVGLFSKFSEVRTCKYLN